MEQCWHGNPDMRPTFSQLHNEISFTLTNMAGYMEFSTISLTITADTAVWLPTQDVGMARKQNGWSQQSVVPTQRLLRSVCMCICNNTLSAYLTLLNSWFDEKLLKTDGAVLAKGTSLDEFHGYSLGVLSWGITARVKALGLAGEEESEKEDDERRFSPLPGSSL